MKGMQKFTVLTASAVFALTSFNALADSAAADPGAFPPNAQAGKCYAKVIVPAKYETRTERVLVQEKTTYQKVIPARYGWAEEKVMVKEATKEIRVIPATYKWAEQRVVVKPASNKEVLVKPEYEITQERVLVEPARKVWKKGQGPIQKLDGATGEIMCLVEVPAKYKVVKKKVLKRAATTKVVNIPAEYKVVRKQVVDRQATTKEVVIPAKYKTVRVKKVIEPERKETIKIPPKYQTLTKRVKTVDEKLMWKSILCQTNMTKNVVLDLQRALKARGYNPGKLDGVVGRETLDATARYQGDHGLARGGLTIETLERLGVTL